MRVQTKQKATKSTRKQDKIGMYKIFCVPFTSVQDCEVWKNWNYNK